jgi:hypothetical protein
MLDAQGEVIAWDAVTIGNGIAGIAANDASNLTTSGVPKLLTFGTVQNQSVAVNIPRGAPLNDGNMLVQVANVDTIFKGQVGPAQLVANAVLGHNYGLTKDSDNHWYIDLAVDNQPTSVVLATRKDTNDPRGIYFVFILEVCQIPA